MSGGPRKGGPDAASIWGLIMRSLMQGVEVFAIYQALSTIDRRQEENRRYTIFVDSTSAITRVRDDSLGPGQRLAVAAIEACSRVLARNNDVAIRWVPAHSGAVGNEVADRYAKSTTSGEDPVEEMPEGYADKTSLSHMTRFAHDKSRYRG